MATTPESKDDGSNEKSGPPKSKTYANRVDRRVESKKTGHNRRVTDNEWTTWTNRTRDATFLVLGLAGTINQLFFANPPNPVLYPILASLLGAPFALALDERRRQGRGDQDET